MPEWPEWFATAVLGAVLALLGYVGKSLAEWIGSVRADRRRRRARLLQLMALIRAGDAAWAVQRVNRNRLTESIRTRSSVAGNDEGYDRLFANAFLGMSQEEKELHAVIRAITVHTFKPLNDELLEWLATDADFRVYPVDHSPRGRLAKYLADLEAHLILWRAKFTAWIPDHPERALVYLADEQRHGLGFPQGGMKLIEAVLHPKGGVGV